MWYSIYRIVAARPWRAFIQSQKYLSTLNPPQVRLWRMAEHLNKNIWSAPNWVSAAGWYSARREPISKIKKEEDKMAGEVFEFTGTITCRVESIEEVEKEFCVNPDWERAWQVWYDKGIPSAFAQLAQETAKKAVSATYNVPIETLRTETGRGAFVDVLMY